MTDRPERHIAFEVFKASSTKYLRMVAEGHQIVVHRDGKIVMVLGRNGYHIEPDEELDKYLAGISEGDFVDKGAWLC